MRKLTWLKNQPRVSNTETNNMYTNQNIYYEENLISSNIF